MVGWDSLYRKLMGESSLRKELIVQRRRIFIGVLLWIVCTPLLAILLGPSLIFRVIVGGSWLTLFALTLRYFYFLLFKKDE